MKSFFYHLFFILFLYLISTYSLEAQTRLQNLQKSLFNAPKDSVTNILNKISEELSKEKINQAKLIWDGLLNQAQKEKKEDLINLIYKANISFYNNLNRKADQIEAIHKLINYCKANKILNEQGWAYYNLAGIYRGANRFDKALENYLFALDVYSKSKDSAQIFNLKSELGNFYYSHDVEKSREYALQAYQIKKYAPETRASISNINTIALTYWKEKDNANALKYYELALKEAYQYKDIEWVGIISGNMSLIYLDQKEYDKALFYILKDLSASRDDRNTANAFLGIGDIYIWPKSNIP